MTDRFPDYDVLAKQGGPSWNDRTRRVVEHRLALEIDEDVLGTARTATLVALVDRVVPQPTDRPPVNAAALVIAKIAQDEGDGYRPEAMPRLADAWRQGLDAIDAEANDRHGTGFAALDGAQADVLLRAIANGSVRNSGWSGLPSGLFWSWRILPDIVSAYYAHPSTWSAMGFGGPAAPRGYVRLDANRRDGWEAADRGDGRMIGAARRNRHVR